eukprot:s469_g42.t1
MRRETEAAENQRLREEVRELREDLRRLTLRVDRQGDQISDLSESFASGSAGPSLGASEIEVVSSVPSAASAAGASSAAPPADSGPPYTQAFRDSVAREIGQFLRRALNGENRGESGREKLRGLQSRYYIIVKDAQDTIHDPVLVVSKFYTVRNHCHHGDGWGDSIFVGVPTQREALLAALDDGSDLEGVELTPRDFVVVQPEGPCESEFRVGRLKIPSSGVVVAAIAVAVVENKLLVALPEAVWSRTVAKRLLPNRALLKPILCRVAACELDDRSRVLEGVECRVWFGLISPLFEPLLDFFSEDFFEIDFSPEEGAPILPFADALVEVSKEHFTFYTAESAVPECPPAFPVAQEARIQKLEDTLGGIQANLEKLLAGNGSGSAGAQPKAAPLPPPPTSSAAAKATKRASAGQVPDVPGLDKEAVAAALAAGVPLHHLQELGGVLHQRPKRLDELPRKAVGGKPRGPLSESEEEPAECEEELVPAESGEPGGRGQMETAILQLTAIAKQLTAPKDKKEKIESLLDGGGSGQAQSSESGSSGTNRKNSAAMRALQKMLLEDPKYIYQTMEANLQSDFIARPVQPGEPLAAGASVRGWLTSRSRIQLYHNHVRWSWQVAGIWHALINDKPAEARARCALLLGAADQASIDGGNWVVSNVALLEAPPPYQAFAHHQQPTALELQHSALYDPRWAEIFLGHLKEVDSFTDAKRKLSSGSSNRQQLKDAAEDGGGKKGKPKAKAKSDKEEKGKKAGSSQEGAAQSG